MHGYAAVMVVFVMAALAHCLLAAYTCAALAYTCVCACVCEFVVCLPHGPFTGHDRAYDRSDRVYCRWYRALSMRVPAAWCSVLRALSAPALVIMVACSSVRLNRIQLIQFARAVTNVIRASDAIAYIGTHAHTDTLERASLATLVAGSRRIGSFGKAETTKPRFIADQHKQSRRIVWPYMCAIAFVFLFSIIANYFIV